MQTLMIVAVGLSLICIGPLLFFLSLRWLINPDDVSTRLNEYITEPVLRKRRRFAPGLAAYTRDIRGSIMTRLLLPWFKRIGRLFGRLTPAGAVEELARKLVIAGNPMGLGVREYYGIKLLFMLAGFALASIILSQDASRRGIVMGVMSVVIFYFYPISWLDRKVKERQNKIRKGLPDALDMLSVCTSAGLGFDQSLQRVSEHWNTPVGIEFGRVITEMEMGLSRRDALHNMVDRVDVAELSSFVSFVLQTDQLGLSIADTLSSHADQMRVQRRLRAQEQAQKVPTKMLIPMVFLIFPALMAVIVGPVFPPLLEFFQGLTGGP